MHKIIIWLFTFIITTELFAVLPELSPLVCEGKIQVDGKLDEAVWNTGDWQSLNHKVSKFKQLSQTTRFKVLQSSKGLYFAFNIKANSIKSSLRKHDGAVWNDDCIEIFLAPEREFSPDRNVREYSHFICNASGSRYDGYNIGGVESSKLNPRWKTAAQKTASGFDLEIFIPFYSLKLFKGCRNWRMNVARIDKSVKNKTVVTSWSPTQIIGECDNFGILKNIKVDFARFGITFDQINFDIDVSGGKTRGVVQAKIDGAPGRSVQLTSVVSQNGKLRGVMHSTVILPSSGKLKTALPVAIEKSGNYQIRIFATDKEGIYANREFDCKADFIPLRFTMLNPCYRNTLYSRQRDRVLCFNVDLRLSESQLAKTQLSLKVRNATGKNIALQQCLALKKHQQFSFDTAKWPVGKYTIELKLKGFASGKLETTLNILPKLSGNEIWIDSKNRLIINGKPFFPHGFLGGGSSVLQPHRDAACNVIHFYTLHYLTIPEIISRLDACEKAGLKVLMYPYYRTGVSSWGVRHNKKYLPRFSDVQWQRIREMVDAIKFHPALLGWMYYDEPRGSQWHTALKRVYEYLKQIDPGHIVAGIDNGIDGCMAKQDYADIQLFDIYSNPFKNGAPQRSIELLVNSSAKLVDNIGKHPVWQVPQAFDVDSFMKGSTPVSRRAPTFRESRATIFGALTAGAQGILAYKIGRPDSKYFVRHSNAGVYASPEMKIGYLECIMPELAALENVLLAPTIKLVASPQKLRILAKKYNGKYFVIALNPTTKVLKAQISWPDQVDKIKVLSEKRFVALRNGVLKESFEPYDVHIYTDSSEFADPVDLAAVNDKIKRELRKTK
jgi:cellulose/xylan binding protein with CBM9 domain